jgi:hypothetical protein
VARYDKAACDAMSSADFYDLSNVDGVSSLWASLTALGGFESKGPGAPSAEFNCGSPAMRGAFDLATCPQPMRIARNDANAFGFAANASVDDAIGCLSACAWMALVGGRYVANRTVVPTRNASAPLVGPVGPDDIAATCCECGHGVNNGACPAPRPDGSWPARNERCIAGCSPFGAYPPSYALSRCRTEHMPTIVLDVRDGGGAIELGRVQALFKAWAPAAYSWQFDDDASTFTCNQADYRITFGPAAAV